MLMGLFEIQIFENGDHGFYSHHAENLLSELVLRTLNLLTENSQGTGL